MNDVYDTDHFIYMLKNIKATWQSFKFLSEFIISIYRKQELIAMNKLGKV